MRFAHGKTGSMLNATPILLAAAAPDAAQTGNAVLIFVAVAVPIISLVLGVLSIWIAGRRQPPIAEEMYKKFVPRAESGETIQRLDERIGEAFKEIGSLRTHADNEMGVIRSNLTRAFGDFERALGRIEGKLDTTKD